jgi:hypothetical protein
VRCAQPKELVAEIAEHGFATHIFCDLCVILPEAGRPSEGLLLKLCEREVRLEPVCSIADYMDVSGNIAFLRNDPIQRGRTLRPPFAEDDRNA